MKGDFTRETFRSANHFSRVLFQQGRVTTDADPNEQSAILLHMLRTLARDLIGPYAAPREAGGFQIVKAPQGGFSIGRGRYYVDGILVENETDCLYGEQPDYPVPADDVLMAEANDPKGKVLWVYLDVWERLITPIDVPQIREVALNGPDTSLRSKVVWQVKVMDAGMTFAQVEKAKQPPACDAPLAKLAALSKAAMAARVDPGDVPDDPCILPPEARYRGAENQLYRVEVHDGGSAATATFKWARDNASRVTAWLGSTGDALQVADSRGFSAGNWVELSHDALELLGRPGTLVRIAKVEPGTLTLDPASVADILPFTSSLVKPKVRRWDQVQKGATLLRNGAVPLVEGKAAEPAWIGLEDGVQIAFSPGGQYRTGDYWEIPARVATGKVEWPTRTTANGEVSQALAPRGIEHHYAPLAYIAFKGEDLLVHGCRCDFDPASSCFQLGSIAIGAQLLRDAPVVAAPQRGEAVAALAPTPGKTG